MSKRNKLIEEHYRQNYKQFVKLATNRVPNKSVALAEEAVQEAYTLAIKYFRTYDPAKGNFQNWFYYILRNAIKATMNREGSVTIVELDETSMSATDLDRKYIAWILQHIDQSKEPEQTVLRMFFYHGFKTIEIAEFLNKKHDAIRQTIYKWRVNSGLNALIETNT